MTHPKTGPHLAMAAHLKGRGRRKRFLSNLLALQQVHLSWSSGIPLLVLEPTWLVSQRPAEGPTLWAEQLLDSWSFCPNTVIAHCQQDEMEPGQGLTGWSLVAASKQLPWSSVGKKTGRSPLVLTWSQLRKEPQYSWGAFPNQSH